MSPNNSILSPNHKTTSCVKNENGKRKEKMSFLRTSKNDVTDDFYFERKKSIKHSQVDIDNAVLTAPNGCIMTRNKLKKQLGSIDYSELVKTTVIEDKCLKIDNIRSKSEKEDTKTNAVGKINTNTSCILKVADSSKDERTIDCLSSAASIKNFTTDVNICEKNLINPKKKQYSEIKFIKANNNRKPSNEIHTDMLQLGLVFTNEISSPYPGKQLDTYCKKRTPSLFESDSDPENDYFQIKDSIKNEVEEISTCISYPDDRLYPASDKNVDLRTYFNKKLYPVNNKSDVQSLNTFEKINEEPSSLCYRDKTAHDSNQYKNISQNYSKPSKSLKVTGPTTGVQINSEGDEFIIVTESFIRQLKNELEITKIQSQDIVKNSLMSIFDEPKETILVESYDYINNCLIIDLDYNNSTTISEEIIDLSNIQTFKCDNSSSDQSIENHPNSEKNITCHLSQDQIESNQYFHTVNKDEIKNKTKYYNSKGRNNCLLKNDNLSSTNDSYSNKNDLNSKCYCKNFRSFNKDVNKIFTSKIKHFAFNNNAKKLREKILREKHLEANILNMLITKEHKNIIQSSEHIPIFNSISIDEKYEKCIDLKQNHHIKPEDTKTNAVGKINTNTSCILKVADSSKDERTIDCLSSAASIKNFTTDVNICEKNLINPKKKQYSEIKFIKVSNPILPKNISNNPITKENNSVSLQKPNAQKSNSPQKSRIPGIIDSEKETNITLLFEPPQYKNFFDTSNTISSKAYQICPMLPHTFENNNNEPVNNLFDLSVDDNTFSLNNKSSDDDGNRKLIDFTTNMKFCEKKLINSKKKQSSEINIINEKVSNSILPKQNSLDDCMSFKMCNEFYKIKSLNKSIVSKNESLPKHIQDILKEMYVDELFVSTCQHMVDSYTPMLSHISENNEPVNNLFDLGTC